MTAKTANIMIINAAKIGPILILERVLIMQWCMYEPEVKDDFWFLEVPSNVGPLIWGPLLNRNVFLHLGQVTSKTPLLRGSRILQLHCVH